MFKRLFCVVLALMLLVFSAVAEEPAYILLEGISWQSTPEEVKQVLGEKAVLEEERSEIMGKLAYVGLEGGMVAGVECVRIQFAFHDDAAMSGSCFFTAEQLPEPELLVDRLKLVYGEPEPGQESEYVLNLWNTGGTEIVLRDLGDMYDDYRYSLSFTNLPVANAFDETMNSWLEYIESED